MRFVILFLMLQMACLQSIAADAPQLFSQHCAACHGAGRLVGTGPALLPESLARLKKPEALKTISEGRVATRMPAFGEKLSSVEIQLLLDYVFTPLANVPNWGDAEIRTSRIEVHKT